MNMRNISNDLSEVDAETRAACETTVVSFMAHFDQRTFDAMEAYLHPDGQWVRAEGVVHGIDGLRELARTIRTDVRVRHVMSNFRTTRRDPAHVTVYSYVTVYRETFTDQASPARLAGPHLVGRYTDELVLVDGQWKIMRKSVIRDFVAD